MNSILKKAIQAVTEDSLRQIQQTLGSREDQHARLSAMAGLSPEGSLLPPAHTCRVCGCCISKGCPMEQPDCPINQKKE